MARKALIKKAERKPKFSTRGYTRCFPCGRSNAVYKKYLLCRICFLNFIIQGFIPGFTKSSW